MNKVIINIGLVLLFANTIVGLLLTNYSNFNWLTADAVLLVNIFLNYEVSTSKRNDGFKISLSFIYFFLTIISVILAILSPCRVKDNYFIIIIILIAFFEFALWLITRNRKAINSNS